MCTGHCRACRLPSHNQKPFRNHQTLPNPARMVSAQQSQLTETRSVQLSGIRANNQAIASVTLWHAKSPWPERLPLLSGRRNIAGTSSASSGSWTANSEFCKRLVNCDQSGRWPPLLLLERVHRRLYSQVSGFALLPIAPSAAAASRRTKGFRCVRAWTRTSTV